MVHKIQSADELALKEWYQLPLSLKWNHETRRWEEFSQKNSEGKQSWVENAIQDFCEKHQSMCFEWRMRKLQSSVKIMHFFHAFDLDIKLMNCQHLKDYIMIWGTYCSKDKKILFIKTKNSDECDFIHGLSGIGPCLLLLSTQSLRCWSPQQCVAACLNKKEVGKDEQMGLIVHTQHTQMAGIRAVFVFLWSFQHCTVWHSDDLSHPWCMPSILLLSWRWLAWVCSSNAKATSSTKVRKDSIQGDADGSQCSSSRWLDPCNSHQNMPQTGLVWMSLEPTRDSGSCFRLSFKIFGLLSSGFHDDMAWEGSSTTGHFCIKCP